MYSLCAGACDNGERCSGTPRRTRSGGRWLASKHAGRSFLEEWVTVTRHNPSKVPKSWHKMKCYKAIPKGDWCAKGSDVQESRRCSKTGMLEAHGWEAGEKGSEAGIATGMGQHLVINTIIITAIIFCWLSRAGLDTHGLFLAISCLLTALRMGKSSGGKEIWLKEFSEPRLWLQRGLLENRGFVRKNNPKFLERGWLQSLTETLNMLKGR